jgi:hypothetical protein
MKADQLEKLVERLSQAFLNSAKATGSNTKNVLLPPASEREISAYEAKNGVKFPESYRQFLLLHNGWKKFENDYTLTGVSGPHTDQALRDFKKLEKAFLQQWKTAGRSTDAKFIESYQAASGDGGTLEDAKLYLPALVKFGTNLANGYFAFNPRRPDKDGEPEVISGYFLTKILRRHKNFIAFLERTLEGYSARGY